MSVQTQEFLLPDASRAQDFGARLTTRYRKAEPLGQPCLVGLFTSRDTGSTQVVI